MVLPEGTGSDSRGARSGRSTLLVVAVVAVLVGLLSLGVLTSPDPAAIEALQSTTTSSSTTSTTVAIEPPLDLENFTLSQITTGEQFEWELMLGSDDLYPHSLVAHEGDIYAFSSSEVMWGPEPARITAWRSPDGVSWERLGTVLDAARVGGFASTPQGLVGFELDDDASVSIWRSQDGTNWTSSEVKSSGDAGNRQSIWPMAIGGTDDLLMLATEETVDVQGLIAEKLREAGIEGGMNPLYGWGTQSGANGELHVVFHGPLGLTADVVPLDDLGLTDEERVWVANGYSGESTTSLWISRDGSQWDRTSIEDHAWIQSFTPAPDGGVFAFGWGNTGDRIWHSPDGRTWTPQQPSPRPQMAQPWRDGLIGLNSNSSRPELLTSADGSEWVDTDLDEHFPLPISWYSNQMAAGDAGVAVLVNGWQENLATAPSTPEPVVLTRDGVTLSLDMNEGRIEVESGGRTQMVSMWSSTIQEGVDVDFEDERVTFLDGDTGEALTSFTFDELNEAESRYWRDPHGLANELRALAFTPDGETWTIQDAQEAIGPQLAIAHVAVTDERLVALVQSSEFIGAPGPPGFEVWTAEIP